MIVGHYLESINQWEEIPAGFRFLRVLEKLEISFQALIKKE